MADQLHKKARLADDAGSSRGKGGQAPPLPPGVAYVGVLNRKMKQVVPSFQNYFGGVCVRDLALDTGCNSMLLYLDENSYVQQLKQFLQSHPHTSYYYLLGRGKSASGEHITLVVHSAANVPDIKVTLAKDLGGVEMQVKRLRFYLTRQQCEWLVDRAAKIGLPLANFETSNLVGPILKVVKLEPSELKELVKACSTKARSVALVGQEVLQLFSSYEHSQIRVAIYDKTAFPKCLPDADDLLIKYSMSLQQYIYDPSQAELLDLEDEESARDIRGVGSPPKPQREVLDDSP